VSWDEALDAIADQTDHGGLKRMVSDISEQVKSGTEFSQALEKYSKCFGKLFISMMRASEASGTMGMMLQRVSDYMVQERDTVKRIKGAMIYPLVVLCAATGILAFLLTAIIPKFEEIFKDLLEGKKLPAITQFVMAASKTVRGNGASSFFKLMPATSSHPASALATSSLRSASTGLICSSWRMEPSRLINPLMWATVLETPRNASARQPPSAAASAVHGLQPSPSSLPLLSSLALPWPAAGRAKPCPPGQLRPRP